MRTPAELYVRSTRPYRGVRVARYPLGLDVRKVKTGGITVHQGQRVFVGNGFAGYVVGIEPVAATVLRIWFYEQDLGLFETPLLAAANGSVSSTKSTAVTPKARKLVTRSKPAARKRTRRRA